VQTMPVPPVNHPLDTGGQLFLTVATTLAGVVALTLIARMVRRERTVWPVVVVASGILCLFLEPVYDQLFNIWFYDNGEVWEFYTAWGMAQPIWVPLTYLWCYGSLAIDTARRVDRGLTRGGAVKLAGVFLLIYVTFEVIGINLGVYTYFGPHPFRVANFPIWVSISNAVIGVVAGIAVARLRPLLPGRSVWALLPVVPAVFAMVSFGGSFPALVAMNMPDPPTALVWAAAVLSMALAAATLYLASLLLPSGARVALEIDEVPVSGVSAATARAGTA
jgi:hypothetical protein